MNKIIKFESTDQRRTAIEEAACGWLAKLEAGASNDEMKALSAWLLESNDHIEIFFEASAAWDQLGILLELSDVFPLEKYRSLPRKETGFWAGSGILTSLATVFIIAAGLLGYSYVEWQESGTLTDVTTYRTDVGQRSTVTLPDSSEIVLNTNTLLEVRYSRTERRIVLQSGEALFTVTKDAGRPFRVVAGSHVVEAIGTAFAVQKMGDDYVEIIVREGVVGLSNLDQSPTNLNGTTQSGRRPESEGISLVAGEVITSDGMRSEVTEIENLPLEEIDFRLSWQQGIVYFLDEPLEKVITEVSRYTTTLIMTDEDVREIRVDGSFRVGDIDALLTAMEQNFGIQVRTVSDGYVYLSKVNEN